MFLPQSWSRTNQTLNDQRNVLQFCYTIDGISPVEKQCRHRVKKGLTGKVYISHVSTMYSPWFMNTGTPDPLFCNYKQDQSLHKPFKTIHGTLMSTGHTSLKFFQVMTMSILVLLVTRRYVLIDQFSFSLQLSFKIPFCNSFMHMNYFTPVMVNNAIIPRIICLVRVRNFYFVTCIALLPKKSFTTHTYKYLYSLCIMEVVYQTTEQGTVRGMRRECQQYKYNVSPWKPTVFFIWFWKLFLVALHLAQC